MKAILLLAAGAVIGAPILRLLAESANPEPASMQQQIEFESKFFTISAVAARRLGLIHLPDESAKWRGVLSATEYEDLLRVVSGASGVDILSAPRVTTKAGQRAVIEIIREFRYPTGFELSPASPAGAKALQVLAPSSFETRNTGITLEVEGTILPDKRISVVATPNLTEFEGFASYAGGKTQKSQTIPAGGFSQPVFDSIRLDSTGASVVSGETILMGGVPRVESGPVAQEATRHPAARPVRNLSSAEPDLLFIALTAKDASVPIRPARKAADLKIAPRVKIETRLLNTTVDRLPAGLHGPDLYPAPNSLVPGVPPPVRAAALVAVLTPAAMVGTNLSITESSGAQFSAGPEIVIPADGRYYVEASGPLIYPVGSVSGTASAKHKKPVKAAELLDLQLEAKAQVNEDSTIDLYVVPVLKVSDPPRTALQNLDERALGASGLVWKTPELSSKDSPQWRGRAVTTSITLYDGQTVILVNGPEGRKGRVQVLLITATALAGGGSPAASPPTQNAPEGSK